MADGGITKLGAVNQILRGSRIRPVTSLGSTGTWPNLTYASGEHGDAEQTLDEVAKEIQTEPNLSNTDPFVILTANGSDLVPLDFATLSYYVLSVRAVGKDTGRTFTVRNEQLYDQYAASSTFTDGSTVHLSITKLLDFEDCSPDLREKITKAAIQRHYEIIMQRADVAEAHARNSARAELNSQRVQDPQADPRSTPFIAEPASRGDGARGR